jgi:hypothetical protein
MYKLGIMGRGVVELCDPDLLQVGHAEYPLGLLSGAAQARHQHGDQYGNDGSHHEQLDQGEPGRAFSRLPHGLSGYGGLRQQQFGEREILASFSHFIVSL